MVSVLTGLTMRRVLTAEYDDFRLVSAYFPSGTTGDLRQDMKMKFLDHFAICNGP